jgi:hypothetical protein
MSLRLAKLTVAIAAGASTGSGTFSPFPSGYIEEIYLDHGQTGGGTCVTITEANPTKTILAVSNSPTDGAFYPRAIAVTTANVSTGSGGVVPIAVCNPLTVSVTGGNVATAALTVYAKVRTL